MMTNFSSAEERVPWIKGRYFHTYKDPDRYDGSDDLNDFIQHFEMVAQWNGWNEEEKIYKWSPHTPDRSL